MKNDFPINAVRQFSYNGKERVGKVVQHVNENVFRFELADGSFRCFDARKCVQPDWTSVTA
jgi:hypothetical protein